MNTLTAYLLVFVLAAIPWFEVLLVVPAGVVAGLAPLPTVLVAAVGNIATLIPVVLGGDRMRAAWRRRRRRRAAPGRQAGDAPGPGRAPHPDQQGPAEHARSGRARRVFDRYGLPGLALLGPLLTGVHVAALVGIAAGATRRSSILWLSAGVLGWAAVAAGATVLGLDAFVDTDRLPTIG